MVDLSISLISAVKTGKVVFGFKETLAEVGRARAKMVVVASNCPRNKQDLLTEKSKSANVPLFIYPGSGFDLGLDCGKQFTISSLAIRDAGDSDILRLVQEE